MQIKERLTVHVPKSLKVELMEEAQREDRTLSAHVSRILEGREPEYLNRRVKSKS